MWKIVDKTKTSYNDSFEYVAFTDDVNVAKAFRESKDYDVIEVTWSLELMRYEVYSRHTWFEVLVPNTQNKYVTFRLVAYFKNYQIAQYYIGGKYTFRQINSKSDLMTGRASELY